MTQTGWTSVVLAAGQGTRMKSAVPKVLHPIAGWPMVFYPLDAALEAGVARNTVVVGHAREQVQAAIRQRYDATRVSFAEQKQPLGTADAVRAALGVLPSDTQKVLILYGDTPLVTPDAIGTLMHMYDTHACDVAMLTGTLTQPKGYGRILRDSEGQVCAIREDKDCSAIEREVCEVNPGFYATSRAFLETMLGKVSNTNVQKEFYLTDMIALAHAGQGVQAHSWSMQELCGVNDRYELALAQKAMYARVAQHWAREGVGFQDPDAVYIDRSVTLGVDTQIEANVTIKGASRLGSGVFVGAGSYLVDAEVADRVVIRPYCVVDKSVLGEASEIGPFARLREGTWLGAKAKLGNFVETKKVRLGAGSKANHLSYLGDGEVGAEVNIGAGTIFCNYDGQQKHVTVLEDGVFIGSDSQLVAPVRVGKGAYVASGTTVTEDVPPGALALSRPALTIKENYVEKLKSKK